MPFLDRDEIARSLTGAWRVFLDKPDAQRFFDLSLDGFWRSFRAFVLMAPAYALTAVAEYQSLVGTTDAGFSDSAFFVAKAIASGFDWVLFPILLALVAEPLGITRSYTSFIIARNWGSVLASIPFLVIDLLYISGGLGEDATNIASLIALIVQLRYAYLIASRALGVGVGLAVGIAVADFAVSLMIMAIASGVAGLPIQ
jgi:hypothetical protein